jgi:hypothetical protein
LEIIIVFLALIVAVISLYIQRQHNRKQMLPLLHIQHNVHSQGGHLHVDYKLINDGQGPAQLKSFTLNIAGENFNIKHYNELLEVFTRFLPNIQDNEVRLSHCVRANSELTVLSYKLPNGHEDPFSTSEMIVEATSVYEDLITVDNSGFRIQSNPRDRVFERAFDPVVNLLVKVGNKNN